MHMVWYGDGMGCRNCNILTYITVTCILFNQLLICLCQINVLLVMTCAFHAEACLAYMLHLSVLILGACMRLRNRRKVAGVWGLGRPNTHWSLQSAWLNGGLLDSVVLAGCETVSVIGQPG